MVIGIGVDIVGIVQIDPWFYFFIIWFYYISLFYLIKNVKNSENVHINPHGPPYIGCGVVGGPSITSVFIIIRISTSYYYDHTNKGQVN